VILVDSSVWIDFFNGRANETSDTLAALLEEGAAPLAIADLVLFEVLRGFRHERDYLAASRALRALDVVSIGGETTARSAAQHYRELRARGVTIASPIDVLQAAYCIENNYALLHSDRDFEFLETLRGLRVWRQ
jgi:predicted nucleic acid-binding protein